MCSRRRQIENLMKRNGYWLHRNRKHGVWRDDFGNQVITASTPKHRNTLNIIQREINSKRKAI